MFGTRGALWRFNYVWYHGGPYGDLTMFGTMGVLWRFNYVWYRGGPMEI